MKPPNHMNGSSPLSRRTVIITFTTSLLCLYALAYHQDTLSSKLGPRKQEVLWAMYSPYTPVAEYESPPNHCQVVQVNILQRHGARYPTEGADERIRSALSKLQVFHDYKDPSLAFLNSYAYSLGTNDMIPLGANQSFESGQVTFERYKHLVNKDNIPFIRASDSTRVIDTALNWIAGFAAASGQVYDPPLSVIISEEEGTNSTLDHTLCKNAGDGDDQTDTWLSVFVPPIRQRLSSLQDLSVAQTVAIQSLTDKDVYSLMTICPFESLAFGKPSPFCQLFAGDFDKSDYWGDLDKYYGTGYGQPLGRVQGVGYVNELIARLTKSPVQDNTQTNRTLDSSPSTFPLDRNIYADFSHDNQMIAIYSALGLFQQPSPLDPQSIAVGSTWKVRRMVPFSARMVVEKLDCVGAAKVRILVNDKVMPLDQCRGVKNGVCTLDAFLESQSYARHDGEGDFEKCN